MKLQFTELTKAHMRSSYIDDINRLLPQLSLHIEPCTAEWINCLFDSGTRLFVALDNDKVVGAVLLCTTICLAGRKDWIEDVIVDQAYRRRNIARTLMEMAQKASQDHGAKSINLTSNPERSGARKMYSNMGYNKRNTDVFRLNLSTLKPR